MAAKPAPNTTATRRTKRSVLDQWRLPHEYQQAYVEKFPSMPSLVWFMRQHRAELLEAGALCFIAGRLYVHSKLFTEVVVEAGQRVLKARHPATRKDTAADA